MKLIYYNARFGLDGPALRATAMITYANYLIDNGNITGVKNTLWPIMYVSQPVHMHSDM
jgi:hypothetical protein